MASQTTTLADVQPALKVVYGGRKRKAKRITPKTAAATVRPRMVKRRM